MIGIDRNKVLQFGHGCDAVETMNCLTKEARDAALQFGHGCDAVETLQPP